MSKIPEDDDVFHGSKGLDYLELLAAELSNVVGGGITKNMHVERMMTITESTQPRDEGTR